MLLPHAPLSQVACRQLEVQKQDSKLGVYLVPVDKDGVTENARLGTYFTLSLQRQTGEPQTWTSEAACAPLLYDQHATAVTCCTIQAFTTSATPRALACPPLWRQLRSRSSRAASLMQLERLRFRSLSRCAMAA